MLPSLRALERPKNHIFWLRIEGVIAKIEDCNLPRKRGRLYTFVLARFWLIFDVLIRIRKLTIIAFRIWFYLVDQSSFRLTRLEIEWGMGVARVVDLTGLFLPNSGSFSTFEVAFESWRWYLSVSGLGSSIDSFFILLEMLHHRSSYCIGL
jgi:hypothetical protein